MSKKITLATLKSFIRKNRGSLHIRVASRFDGMVDGIMPTSNPDFTPAKDADRAFDANLGIAGVWVVRGSRDYFTPYNDGKFEGIECFNSCGKFVVAVLKNCG